jgi:DNA-binding GntR family transcriptional regulator
LKKGAFRRSNSGARPKITGSQRAYETLQNKILRLELRPGAQIDESSLVSLLKVSRTPLREALIRLSAEDLVVLSPNRGAYVAPIDLGRTRAFHEVLDLCQRAANHWAALRRAPANLEEIRAAMVAFEEAAARHDSDGMIEANRDFHSAIGRATQNDYLAQAYDRLLAQGLRVARIAFDYDFNNDADKTLDKHLRRTMDEHELMLKYVAAGDAIRAEQLAGSHAKRGLARLAHSMASGLATQIGIPVYPDVARPAATAGGHGRLSSGPLTPKQMSTGD